jgi:hypothetical protein
LSAQTSGTLLITFDAPVLHGIAHNKFICKLGFAPRVGVGLHQVEREVYEQLGLLRRWLPFVIHMAVSFECDPRRLKLRNPRAEQWFRDVVRTGMFHTHTVTVLVLERGVGQSLHALSASGRLRKLTRLELLHILAQAAYTFAVPESLGIWHNDVHMHNDLLEEWTDCSGSIDLDLHGSKVSVKASPLLKFFDFDMALFRDNSPDRGSALRKRFGGDPCQVMGMCMQPGRDLAQFMHNLRQLQLPPGGQQLIEKIHPFASADRRSMVWPGQPCFRRPTPLPCAVVAHPSSAAVFASIVALIRDDTGATSRGTQVFLPTARAIARSCLQHVCCTAADEVQRVWGWGFRRFDHSVGSSFVPMDLVLRRGLGSPLTHKLRGPPTGPAHRGGRRGASLLLHQHAS